MKANVANGVAGNYSAIDIEKLDNTPLVKEPFEYAIVPNFVKPEAMESILNDYPQIKEGGSFPLSILKYGDAFKSLIETLDGNEFRNAVERKFAIDLTGKPTIFTVRGKCRQKDGKIHTDTESKIISVLIYMNPAWEKDGGRLRLLNSENIDDVITEIPPVSGTLLVFKRSDNSFHGHKQFVGDRKVIQMNWVTDQKFVDNNISRHKFSSLFKKLNPFKEDY
ncbi:MAG: hypothetical protein K0R98_1737 [Rickettsiaceae bacterium]|jgi:hypothetical protein|nr:hypothetical protein [Rickettsiaceae bacterium]